MEEADQDDEPMPDARQRRGLLCSMLIRNVLCVPAIHTPCSENVHMSHR